MDTNFFKILKNKKTTYAKSFVELKNTQEWDNFVQGVKKKILSNSNKEEINICTNCNIWPKNKNNDPIKPNNLALALQKELMLEVQYSNQKVTVFPYRKLSKWKYLNKAQLLVFLVIISGVLTAFMSNFQEKLLNSPILNNIMQVLLSLIMFCMIFTVCSLWGPNGPNDLYNDTRRQFKQLFGK